VGRDSSVGKATRYKLGVKDRIPGEASFSACVRTGAGAHPASYTIVTGLFSGLISLGSGFEHLPTSKAEVKEIGVYLYSPLCLHGIF
jgi:hypothetical protein